MQGSPPSTRLDRASAAEWLRQRLRLPQAPHPVSLARWERGIGCRGGVRLRAVVLGGRSWYDPQDLERFVRETNAEGDAQE